MKKVITYGTYDLLHQGHINLLRRAKELGDYLIVGVTSDSFDRGRGKLNVRNNVLERVEAVKATGYADEVIIEDYVGQKIDDIQKYNIDIFAIGSDWEGIFDYLKEYTKVVYLPRTKGISSTMLRAETTTDVKVGVIGCGRVANRFPLEAGVVNGVVISACYDTKIDAMNNYCRTFDGVKACNSVDALFEMVDAVYIATPHLSHYGYIEQAINAGKHVLVETPMVLNGLQARALFELAEQRGVILMEADKTAHCPAFNHLMVMIKSGVIGEVVDVYTKGVFRFEHAVCSFKVGLGVKTEGNLVISGTKGYAYVPAPWWKTDYFELRYEDQNKNQKFFYKWDGFGLRYEIQEFISCILNKRFSTARLRRRESVCMAEIMQAFSERRNMFEI